MDRRRLFTKLGIVIAAGGLSLLWLRPDHDTPAHATSAAPPAPTLAPPRPTIAYVAPTRLARKVTTIAPPQLPTLAELTQLHEDARRRVTEAEEVAIARCMRERGFEYAEVPYVSDEELRAPRPQAGDPSAAREHGYGFVRQRGEQPYPEPDPNEAVRAQLPPDQLASWERALQGQRAGHAGPAIEDENYARVETPDGTIVWDKRSCWARGREALHGDDEGNYALALRLHELRERARAEAADTPACQQALRAWRACMAQRGHPYPSPEAAREAVASETEAIADVDVALAREVAVAQDDAECDRRAGLQGALQAAITERERAIEAENPETLVAAAEQQRETLARADDLLQGRDQE